jgi:hypothetical protein
MSESLANLVSARLPIVGLVAYSIHLPDRVLATECFSKSLYPSSTEQMLSGVVRLGRSLLPAAESGAHFCWVFECLRVYVAARSDDICLAVMVENNPGVQMVRVREMLQDFVELSEA